VVSAPGAGTLELANDPGVHRVHLALGPGPGAGPPIGTPAPVFLPPGRGCRSARTLTITLPRRHRERVLAVAVYLDGHRVPVHGAARRRRITLRGLPSGTYRVRVVVRLRTRGRVHRTVITRRYRSCPTRRGGARGARMSTWPRSGTPISD
jgi:hypothetical protein